MIIHKYFSLLYFQISIIWCILEKYTYDEVYMKIDATIWYELYDKIKITSEVVQKLRKH